MLEELIERIRRKIKKLEEVEYSRSWEKSRRAYFQRIAYDNVLKWVIEIDNKIKKEYNTINNPIPEGL